MTFDDIKEMQIGSKTVKEAWLNGKQVYPSKRRIIDSLVCWYDIGKQQCTNESMASNPVLTDLSGNGHDITCYNFAWSGMSGVGGYLFNRQVEKWYKSPNCNGIFETHDNTLHITTLNTNNGTCYITNSSTLSELLTVAVDDTGTVVTKPFKMRISGLPEDKQVKINGLICSDVDGVVNNVNLPNQLFGNGEHIVQSVTALNTHTISLVNFPSILIDSDTADEVDITIEFLPEYPNAIVSDGVDDYCYTDGLPILTDYTVIAKREILNNDNKVWFLASKAKNGLGDTGAFQFEGANSTLIPMVSSFGKSKHVDFYSSKDNISYMTTNSYNGLYIDKGSNVDSNKLAIFKFDTSGTSRIGKAVLYSFLLFDRTLTTAEIEWVKTNMVEELEHNEQWYGIEYYTTSSNPDCIRIGNPELHRTLPVHSMMKGCLLNDDGSVNKYLNESDWTSETRDGSQGQVMVEMPQNAYWKFETDGNIRRVKFSTQPLKGFKKIIPMYVSAYQASLQRSTHKLSSVVNTDVDYRGGNNASSWDGTYRSLLGMPATSISRTNFRNYARNRKMGSTEWNCMVYEAQKLIYWLFVVEYATLNTQKAYNSSLTADGYRKGGLGYGVTTLDGGKWNTFNGYNPFIPCGHTDELGNGTGEVEFSMPTEYDSNIKTVKVPRYRGIENPFGHIWQWTDGINVRISPNSPTGDGLSKVFVTDNPEYFNDSNYNNMQHVGNGARTGSYVKEVIFGEGGEIIPSVVGGGSTTYFCDYHYTNIPTSEQLRGVRFGAAANNGANPGLVSAASTDAPSNTNAYIGSRLCFIPE